MSAKKFLNTQSHLDAFLGAKFPEVLAASVVETDLSLLIAALSEAYGGFHFYREEVGRCLDSLRGISGPLTRHELGIRIDEALLGVFDNHLLAQPRRHNYFETRKNSRFKVSGCGGNFLGKRNEFCGLDQIQVHGKRLLVIAIKRFAQPADPAWDAFFGELPGLLVQADGVIVDLRDNLGGNDFVGYRIAQILSAGKTYAHPIACQHQIQNAQAWALQLNTFRLIADEYGHRGEDIPPGLADKQHDLESKMKSASTESLKTVLIEEDPGAQYMTSSDPSFEGPVFVLVNGGTQSAGESTAMAFENNPRATLVGENTRGCIQTGNAGVFILPSSLLLCCIPQHFNERADGLKVEVHGLTPKRVCDKRADALQFVLNLLA